MPSATITATLEIDGRPLPGSPFAHSLTADEARLFAFAIDDGATYQAAADLDQVDTWQVLVLTTTQDVTLRLNGQVSEGTPLRAGGVLVLVRTKIDQVPQLAILNVSGQRAFFRGVLLGTRD